MESCDLFSETMELHYDDIEYFYIESKRVTDRRKKERDYLRQEISILQEEKKELRKENKELRTRNEQLKQRLLSILSRGKKKSKSKHFTCGWEREGDIGGGFEHGDEETVTFAEDAFAHTLVKEIQAPRRAQIAFLHSSWMEVVNSY